MKITTKLWHHSSFRDTNGISVWELVKVNGKLVQCDHKDSMGRSAWIPTFKGGDTYQCQKCGKEMDVTSE